MKPKSRRHCRAFGLIELLVASAITAVLGALMLTIVSHALATWRTSVGRARCEAVAQRVYEQLVADFSSACLENDSRVWLVLSAESGGAYSRDRLVFVATRRGANGGADASVPVGVVYSLHGDGVAGWSLHRREGRPEPAELGRTIDRWSSVAAEPDVDADSPDQRTELAAHVIGFAVGALQREPQTGGLRTVFPNDRGLPPRSRHFVAGEDADETTVYPSIIRVRLRLLAPEGARTLRARPGLPPAEVERIALRHVHEFTWLFELPES